MTATPATLTVRVFARSPRGDLDICTYPTPYPPRVGDLIGIHRDIFRVVEALWTVAGGHPDVVGANPRGTLVVFVEPAPSPFDGQPGRATSPTAEERP